MTESPLLILPYLQDITTSELFAVMVAGFGTISGSVLGAYLGFGVSYFYRICIKTNRLFVLIDDESELRICCVRFTHSLGNRALVA